MLKNMIEIFQTLFRQELFRRILGAFLIPNVLVFGFNLVGIDNDRNYLWRGIVGPYWLLEKSIFFTIVGLFAIAILIPVSLFILAHIVFPLCDLADKKITEYENKKYGRNEEVISEQQIEFIPRPPTMTPEERAKYLKDREEAEAAKYHKFIASIEAENAARAKRENDKRLAEEAERKRREDPKFKAAEAKARALRDITGRGA